MIWENYEELGKENDMAWTGHTEEIDENKYKTIVITTNKRNSSDSWLRDRVQDYQKKGYKVRLKYI